MKLKQTKQTKPLLKILIIFAVLKEVCSLLDVGEATLKLIMDGLEQPIGHDIREGN